MDLKAELQKYVDLLAANAVDEFDFFAMLHESMVLLDAARSAQMRQNAEIAANLALARRAERLAVTVDDLKQELADSRKVHVDTVLASEVLEQPVKREAVEAEISKK